MKGQGNCYIPLRCTSEADFRASHCKHLKTCRIEVGNASLFNVGLRSGLARRYSPTENRQRQTGGFAPSGQLSHNRGADGAWELADHGKADRNSGPRFKLGNGQLDCFSDDAGVNRSPSKVSQRWRIFSFAVSLNWAYGQGRRILISE
jgi:hypothetical protein